ncbi:MAG: TolC family protein [Acidobacteriaceae bacterium]
MKKIVHRFVFVASLCCAAMLAFVPAHARAQTPTQASSPNQTTTPSPTATPGVTLTPVITPSAPLTNAPSATPGVSKAPAASGQITVGPGTGTPAGTTITLAQALTLAQANEPTFVAAVAASKVAALDRSIARAALLPSVDYHNQYLYTQSRGANGLAGPQVFIANNAIHEYVSQGVVTETLGLAQYTALARADAAAAIASAELEISRRGLTATVVGLFYNSNTAQTKVAIQQRALDEAASFLKQTQQREAQGEAAHADVIKAEITLLQRQRDLADARLLIQKSRLDLGVLLFADPRTPYTVTLPAPGPLPERATVEAAANKNNPEIGSALAFVRARGLGIGLARAALFPSLALNYAYGIDAQQFAVNAPDGTRNLGYSASATLDIPIWDWLATEHKVKQAQILHDAAKVQLTAVQRRLIVQFEEFYAEASLAHDQLRSLQLSANDARESLRLSRLRYTAGEATVLEVVDAQNTLTAAEIALQDGTVRYQTALANLQLLTGTI